jgi:WD40 repeat protein
VTSAVFSPDEKQVLTSSVDGTVCLWRSDGDLVMTLTYPRGTYASNWDIWCSFSPDGQHMLVCNENTASLWDTGGRLCTTNWDSRSQLDAYTEAFLQDPSRDDDPCARAESEGHIGRIYSAVFSPDGQRILTASEDKTARIWNLSGQQLVILRGHKDQVINAIFSPFDGRLILTGSNDKTARLWNADGELLAILEGHTADVRHLAFRPTRTIRTKSSHVVVYQLR